MAPILPPPLPGTLRSLAATATEALYRNPLHGEQELLSNTTSEMQAELTREIEESSSSSISDMESEVEGLRCLDSPNLSLPSLSECNFPPGRDEDRKDYCSEEVRNEESKVEVAKVTSEDRAEKSSQ